VPLQSLKKNGYPLAAQQGKTSAFDTAERRARSPQSAAS